MREPGVDRSVDDRLDALSERPAAASSGQKIAFWGGGALVILALSVVSIAYVLPALPVALWWPAAGVSAAFVLRTRTSERPLAIAIVLVATALGNLIAGRQLDVSGLYGAANALEVALLSWLLLRGRDDARLRTTNDAVRFVMWTAVSSITFALAVALINLVLTNGEPVSSALITGASHFSAVLLIVPILLFDPQPQARATVGEFLAQLVAMIVVLAAALGPLTELPLAFLVFVPLAWATLRLPPLYAHAQALAVAILTVLLTRLSVRIFTPSRISVIELAITVAIFLAAIGIFTVVTTTERNESLANARTALDSAEAGAEAARATTTTLQLRYDLERQRQDFLSTTSHELRTPVTIIAGYSELLAESELPVEAATWVDAIHRNTNRLATMLDDLLAFSRTQAEQPRPVEVAASELVSTAIARHIDAATARALALTVAPITDLMVIADRDDAARALGNLISNAVKFTPDEGSIHIETARVADDVMITVGDTGPGIGPDGLVQAFDPFYRGAQSEVRAMAGTGLGLPIARMLARRNGGEVMLVSLPGLGTKATLLLPRAGASREGEESAEAGQ